MPRNRSPASPHGLSSWPVRFTTWFNPGFGRILSHRIACQSARFKKGEPLAHPFFVCPRVFDVYVGAGFSQALFLFHLLRLKRSPYKPKKGEPMAHPFLVLNDNATV